MNRRGRAAFRAHPTRQVSELEGFKGLRLGEGGRRSAARPGAEVIGTVGACLSLAGARGDRGGGRGHRFEAVLRPKSRLAKAE